MSTETNLCMHILFRESNSLRQATVPVKLLLEEQMLWLAVVLMEQVAVVFMEQVAVAFVEQVAIASLAFGVLGVVLESH